MSLFTLTCPLDPQTAVPWDMWSVSVPSCCPQQVHMCEHVLWSSDSTTFMFIQLKPSLLLCYNAFWVMPFAGLILVRRSNKDTPEREDTSSSHICEGPHSPTQPGTVIGQSVKPTKRNEWSHRGRTTSGQVCPVEAVGGASGGGIL